MSSKQKWRTNRSGAANRSHATSRSGGQIEAEPQIEVTPQAEVEEQIEAEPQIEVTPQAEVEPQIEAEPQVEVTSEGQTAFLAKQGDLNQDAVGQERALGNVDKPKGKSAYETSDHVSKSDEHKKRTYSARLYEFKPFLFAFIQNLKQIMDNRL